MQSLGDRIPLGTIRGCVVQRDEVLLAELLEGVGGELSSVVQDDALRRSEVCHVLLQCLSDTVCMCIFQRVKLHKPTKVVYNSEYIPIPLISCYHIC